MSFDPEVGEWTIPTGTGSTSLTGLKESPLVMMFNVEQANSNGFSDHARQGIGFVDANGNEATMAWADEDNISLGVTKTRKRRNGSACISLIDSDGNFLFRAEFTSMDSNGITVNVIDNSLGEIKIGYTSYAGSIIGSNYEVGIFSYNASGSTSTKTVGFKPKLVILGTLFATSVNTVDINLSIGIADGTSSMCKVLLSENGTSTTDSDRAITNDNIAVELDLTGAPVRNYFMTFTETAFVIEKFAGSGNSDHRAMYLAIGGDAVGSKIDAVQEVASPGTHTIIGHNFRPKVNLFLNVSTLAVINAIASNCAGAIGMASGPSAQNFTAIFSENGQSGTTNTYSIKNNSECLIRTNNVRTITGSYEFLAYTATGFNLDKTAGGANPFFLYLSVGDTLRVIIFKDNFSTAAFWTFSGTGNWEIGSPGQVSAFGGDCLATGLSVDYPDGVASTSFATMDAVDCSKSIGTHLSFYRNAAFENDDDFDTFTVQVWNGSVWTIIWTSDDFPDQINDIGWIFQQFDVSAFADGVSDFQVRFSMRSDGSVNFRGWFIDELIIEGLMPGGAIVDNNPLLGNKLLGGTLVH